LDGSLLIVVALSNTDIKMDRDPEKASTQSGGLAEEDERIFAPIHSRPHSANLSRSNSATRSISRVRSQNGYSCNEDESTSLDEQPQALEPEKDPFEVGFENGDADAMCPRSMAKPRKWIIVVIVAMASFCV
jgi:hypothetical protein